MSQTKKAFSSTMFDVPLDNGTTWTGTEAQLRRDHPDWIPYAQVAQPGAQVARVHQPVQRLDGKRPIKEQHAFSYPDDQAHQSQRDSRHYPPASTHRAGHYSGIHPEDAPYMTGGDVEVGEPDEPAYTRPRSSIRTYNQPGAPTQGNIRFEYRPDKVIPRRAHAAPPSDQRDTDNLPEAGPKRQKRARSRFWLVYVGTGMLAMLALWVGLQTVLSWWQVRSDDATYGRPRTYQFDAVFGHNDSAENPTHIIIINLNRHIMLIELPGGDPSHARIYSGPTLFGDGQDLTPVTAKALDVNDDGKLDLVLYVQDQRIVFINDGTQFRPLKPGEQITIPK